MCGAPEGWMPLNVRGAAPAATGRPGSVVGVVAAVGGMGAGAAGEGVVIVGRV